MMANSGNLPLDLRVSSGRTTQLDKHTKTVRLCRSLALDNSSCFHRVEPTLESKFFFATTLRSGGNAAFIGRSKADIAG